MTQTATAETNTYADIKRRLSEPVPANLISHMDRSGRDIPYLNVTDLKDLLDARAGVWESQVTEFKQIGETLCCVVRVTIHASDGMFIQDGTGVEDIIVRGYGDVFSNAYAQAIRRACEGHGLARELWRKDEHGQQTPQRLNSPANPSNPQAPRSFGPTTKPENGKAASPADLATAKQLGMIRALAREYGTDADECANRAFDCSTDELSKKAAGWLIESLQKRIAEKENAR